MKRCIALFTVILSVIALHLFADDDIVQILMRTTMGSMVLELDRSIAPNTVIKCGQRSILLLERCY